MLYLNQYDYAHIPYQHSTEYGGAPQERRNVAKSGCGLCCLCMIVEHLTAKQLTIEECVRLAESTGANGGRGTRIHVLGPVIAQMYGLHYQITSDMSQLLAHLKAGGEAIANVGGDREDHIGLFSHKGHFILAVSANGEEVCILDPSYKEGKFDEEGRIGNVRITEPFIYCSAQALAEDTASRDPAFYLFSKI